MNAIYNAMKQNIIKCPSVPSYKPKILKKSYTKYYTLGMYTVALTKCDLWHREVTNDTNTICDYLLSDIFK